MKIRAVTLIVALTFPFAASAEQMKFSCERFKSNCTGKTCEQLYIALQKEGSKQILAKKKTEVVEYVVDESGAVETLIGAQANPSEDRHLIINYKNVASAYGKLSLTNNDSKGNVKEMANIEPASGFYRYLLIHTDGSIKDVPIGEPYTAYFGWCKNLSQTQQHQQQTPVTSEPETTAPTGQ